MECSPVLYREQTLVREVLEQPRPPFAQEDRARGTRRPGRRHGGPPRCRPEARSQSWRAGTIPERIAKPGILCTPVAGGKRHSCTLRPRSCPGRLTARALPARSLPQARSAATSVERASSAQGLVAGHRDACRNRRRSLLSRRVRQAPFPFRSGATYRRRPRVRPRCHPWEELPVTKILNKSLT